MTNNNTNNTKIIDDELNKNITSESILNNESLNLSVIEKAINVDIIGIPLGASEFQINNFILNKREFPNDYAQFLQAKHEIYTRIQTLLDIFYQYKKAEIEITLSEGKIEKIHAEEKYKKIRDSKITLQRLEIEKNKYTMNSIKNTTNDKLRELSVFYKSYSKNRHFETDSKEEIEKAEEEYWRIKSVYYIELQQRYNLTPNGFVKYPHEEGFENFIRLINRNTDVLCCNNDNDNNNYKQIIKKD